MQTGQVFELGAAPKLTRHPQKSFVRVESCAWTSNPIVGIQRAPVSGEIQADPSRSQALTLHLCDLRSKTCNAPVRSGAKGTQHRCGHVHPAAWEQGGGARFQIAI